MTRDERRAIDVCKELWPGLLLTPFVPWLGIVKESRSAGEWYGKYAAGRSVAAAYRELTDRIVTG